jgi:integrase/recombinase XerD
MEAGVPPERAHPHALKHSIAVHMVEADIPVQLIQRRLGHRSIENTMVYLSIADSHVDRVVRNARQDGYIA